VTITELSPEDPLISRAWRPPKLSITHNMSNFLITRTGSHRFVVAPDGVWVKLS
jgi:hypothetical protein